MNKEVTNPKYMYVAEFYLRDMPTLQNLSALRLLAYAHPNLIAKNAKSFTSRHEVARMMLEAFFCKPSDCCNDEQLVDEVARLVVQHDHKDENEEQQIATADAYVDLTPFDALMALRSSKVAKDRAYLESQNLQPVVLDKIWRLRLIIFLESFVFVVAVYSCAFFGMLEFFTKICRLSFLLTDPTAPWWISAIFFMFLLNQSMGMNSIQELLRWRVETFIFGGSDALVSAEERYTMSMYLALLVDKVWNSSAIPFSQKLAIMLQLDDDDLQQLVVEEKEQKKSEVAASVRKWIRASGGGHFVSDHLARWAVR